MQSRTALVIMPPFFVFALTSEMKVGQKMEQMATEAHHAKEVEEWLQEERKPQMFRYLGSGGIDDHRDSDVRQQEMQMMNVHRKSIENLKLCLGILLQVLRCSMQLFTFAFTEYAIFPTSSQFIV